MKNTILTILGVALLAGLMVYTSNMLGAKGGHSHSTTIPASSQEILAEISSRQSQLDTLLKSNNLRPVHDHGYAIRDLIRALAAKAPEAEKGKVQAAADEAGKLAVEIDKLSRQQDGAATTAAVQKLQQAAATARAAFAAN